MTPPSVRHYYSFKVPLLLLMTDNGPITGTGISVVTDTKWSLGIFFQLLDGQVDLVRHKNGVWFPGDHLKVTPLDASPLASITYQGGKEVSRPLHSRHAA